MKTAKECAKYFLNALKFYSNYNPNLIISMIGFDVDEDYSEIYLALHFEYSLKCIEFGTCEWDENTLVSFDLNRDSNIRKLINKNEEELLVEYIKRIIKEIVNEMILNLDNINCNSKVLFGYNFQDGEFIVIKGILAINKFQKDDKIIQDGLENAVKKEESVEWHKCPNCGVAWARYESICNNCGYDLYE